MSLFRPVTVFMLLCRQTDGRAAQAVSLAFVSNPAVAFRLLNLTASDVSTTAALRDVRGGESIVPRCARPDTSPGNIHQDESTYPQQANHGREEPCVGSRPGWKARGSRKGGVKRGGRGSVFDRRQNKGQEADRNHRRAEDIGRGFMQTVRLDRRRKAKELVNPEAEGDQRNGRAHPGQKRAVLRQARAHKRQLAVHIGPHGGQGGRLIAHGVHPPLGCPRRRIRTAARRDWSGRGRSHRSERPEPPRPEATDPGRPCGRR